MNRILAFVIFTLLCGEAISAESIFSSVGLRRGPPDLPNFVGTRSADYDVEVDVLALATAINPKSTVLLNLPEIAAEPIRFTRMERAECCFIIKGDQVFIDPDAQLDEFSFAWFGKGVRDTHVIFSVEKGKVNGTIAGLDGNWRVNFSSTRQQHYARYGDQSARLPEVVVPLEKLTQFSKMADDPGQHSITLAEGNEQSSSFEKASNDQLQLLVVITENARVGAHMWVNGVAPGPNDTSAVDGIITASIDQMNDSLINSKVSVARVNLAHSQLVVYDESVASPIVTDHLNWLVNDAGVANLRNQFQADVTMMVFDDVACGVAVTQRNVNCNLDVALPPNSCGVGDEFAPAAFSIINYQCAAQFLQFAHELGHVLGLEHDVPNAPPNNETSFPWSYAMVGNNFQTIMGGVGTFIPQMYFSSSDPTLTIGGVPIGNATVDNSRTLNVLFPNSAKFRTSAGELFDDSFEFNSDPAAVFDP